MKSFRTKREGNYLVFKLHEKSEFKYLVKTKYKYDDGIYIIKGKCKTGYTEIYSILFDVAYWDEKNAYNWWQNVFEDYCNGCL